MRHGVVAVAAVVMLAVVASPVVASPVVAEPDVSFVSTSGVPHVDVGDYRESPFWRAGMPDGQNRHWRSFMRDVVGQVTRSDPDVVLHSGDMAFGVWDRYRRHPHVFGPAGSFDERRRTVHTAADVVYPWMKRSWADHRVLWGRGDHEIGGMGRSGRIPADEWRTRAHWQYTLAWRRHFGAERHAELVGNVGFVTLDPFVKLDSGVYAALPHEDRGWLQRRVAELRASGAQWIVVQSETPVLGPNRHRYAGTSQVVYRNADVVWRLLRDLDVDLFLAGEFHDDTTYTDGGRAPVHVVHGGFLLRASWLEVDVFGGDRLELTLWESRGSHVGDEKVWAPSQMRGWRRPVAGSPRVTGSATLLSDGRLVDRTGDLTEGLENPDATTCAYCPDEERERIRRVPDG